MLDPTPTAEDDADSVVLPSEDPVADTGLEVGDVPTTSEPNDGVDSNCVPAARRVVKPVIRLCYDEPGEPTCHSAQRDEDIPHQRCRRTDY